MTPTNTPVPASEAADVERVAANLVKIADASVRSDGTDIPLGEQCRLGAATIRSLKERLAEAERRNASLEQAMRMSDADRRLYFISDRIGKVGHINRSDICDAFGVSVPQASIDIGRWIKLHPGALEYDKSSKRYVRAFLTRLKEGKLPATGATP